MGHAAGAVHGGHGCVHLQAFPIAPRGLPHLGVVVEGVVALKRLQRLPELGHALLVKLAAIATQLCKQPRGRQAVYLVTTGESCQRDLLLSHSCKW